MRLMVRAAAGAAGVMLVAAIVSAGAQAGTIAAGAAPQSSGTNAYACFANSSLEGVNGTWVPPQPFDPHTWTLKAPTYQTGFGTDGHGLGVLNSGFNQGQPCSSSHTGDTDYLVFCFAHSNVLAVPVNNVSTVWGAFGNVFNDRAPKYYTGSDSDGHGLEVFSQGFDEGAC